LNSHRVQITVIFPAFNEAESIRRTLGRALGALRAQFNTFEILIVDDASRDETGRIADELAAENSEIRVFHHSRNQGAGQAFFTGLEHARGEFLIHNAIDYPFDLDDLPLLMGPMEDADVVVAARKRRAGYSGYRILTSVVNRWLLHLLFDLHLADYNFTQLYRKAVLDSIRVESRGTAFVTPEILIRAHAAGFRIKEVEIEYHPRIIGVATSGKPRVIIASLHGMFRLWCSMRSHCKTGAKKD